MGEYLWNSLWTSVKVGGSLLIVMAVPYAAEMFTYSMISPYACFNIMGKIITSGNILSAISGAMGMVTMANTIFQLNDVAMFTMGKKELGAPTGNHLYDSLEQSAEFLALNIGILAVMNPRFGQGVKENFAQRKDNIRGKGSAVISKPNQLHHYAANKDKTYTPQF